MKEVRLNKELYSNLRDALNKASSTGYILDIDEDANSVIFEKWEWDEEEEAGNYFTFKSTYTYDGTVATLTGEPTQVVIKKEVVEVAKKENMLAKSLREMKESLELTIHNTLSNFGATTKDAAPVESIPVIKQLDDEEMIAIEPLYIGRDEIDGHGDGYATQEEVYKMVDSFNQAIADGNLKSNFDHGDFCEDFVAVKAWVNEVDCYIGDTLVPEGQPIVKTQFLDKDKWEARKAGDIKGVSIQASAICIEVEDE